MENISRLPGILTPKELEEERKAKIGLPNCFDFYLTRRNYTKWAEVDLSRFIFNIEENFHFINSLIWGDSFFAPEDSVNIIVGQPGNGKTMLVTLISAAYLGYKGGVIKSLYNDPVKILYVDTEMERANTTLFKNRVLNLAKLNTSDKQAKELFSIVRLREVVDFNDKWFYILKAIQHFNPKIVFIDGLLDIVPILTI